MPGIRESLELNEKNASRANDTAFRWVREDKTNITWKKSRGWKRSEGDRSQEAGDLKLYETGRDHYVELQTEKARKVLERQGNLKDHALVEMERAVRPMGSKGVDLMKEIEKGFELKITPQR